MLSNRTSIGIISNVPRGRKCVKLLLVGSHDVCYYCSDNERDFAIVSFQQAVIGNVKAKSVKAFCSFKPLVVFWTNKKVYVAQELFGMWNL